MTLVYEVVALRTRVGVFEVLDDAGLAECVQAFRHGGGVDKVTMADLKAEHAVFISPRALAR